MGSYGRSTAIARASFATIAWPPSSADAERRGGRSTFNAGPAGIRFKPHPQSGSPLGRGALSVEVENSARLVVWVVREEIFCLRCSAGRGRRDVRADATIGRDPAFASIGHHVVGRP